MLSWDRRAGFIPRGVLAPPKPKKTTNATKSDKNRNFRTCLIRVHPRPSAAKITKRTQPRPPLYRTPNHIPLHKRPRLPNSHPLRKNAHCCATMHNQTRKLLKRQHFAEIERQRAACAPSWTVRPTPPATMPRSSKKCSASRASTYWAVLHTHAFGLRGASPERSSNCHTCTSAFSSGSIFEPPPMAYSTNALSARHPPAGLPPAGLYWMTSARGSRAAARWPSSPMWSATPGVLYWFSTIPVPCASVERCPPG